MTQFFAKKLNKKGFTLAELLIVVAIIAVLVAIAIPIFMGSLEKARVGVHRSNARALKSMAVGDILSDNAFEQYAGENQYYVVIGHYNFAKEEFGIDQIKGYAKADLPTEVPAGQMCASPANLSAATNIATEAKNTKADWSDFADKAGVDVIGRISTAAKTARGK